MYLYLCFSSAASLVIHVWPNLQATFCGCLVPPLLATFGGGPAAFAPFGPAALPISLPQRSHFLLQFLQFGVKNGMKLIFELL
jgi:hypothetical protein